MCRLAAWNSIWFYLSSVFRYRFVLPCVEYAAVKWERVLFYWLVTIILFVRVFHTVLLRYEWITLLSNEHTPKSTKCIYRNRWYFLHINTTAQSDRFTVHLVLFTLFIKNWAFSMFFSHTKPSSHILTRFVVVLFASIFFVLSKSSLYGFFVVEPLLRLVLVDYSVDLKVRRSKCACICVFDIWDCISRNYCMDLGSVRCLSMFCYWTINLWYIRKFIAAIGSTPHTKKRPPANDGGKKIWFGHSVLVTL